MVGVGGFLAIEVSGAQTTASLPSPHAVLPSSDLSSLRKTQDKHGTFRLHKAMGKQWLFSERSWG